MEHRTAPRYPLTCQIETVQSAGRDQERGEPQAVRGTVVDVSAGGACVLSEQSVEWGSVLSCRFHFPAVPVPVPVLAQVRWIQPVPSRKGIFRIGLWFII
jgi:PilZ domain